MTLHFPALVSILAVFVFFYTTIAVGKARTKYSVKAPATTGHEDFERVFRAQMNTLEALVMFLPALWLFTQYVSPLWAGVIGMVWVIGRVDYIVSYSRSASARGRGFATSSLAFAVLALGSLGGIGYQMVMGV